ncbi:MAG: hypothetical protein SR1Q5_00815 [Quinella sp. 1Q5]|nr:hypothetical protein [Quinella sp. 1Q5]
MLIRILPSGHKEVVQTLDPSRIKPRLTAAIRKALKEGKSLGDKEVKARYIRDLKPMGKIRSRAAGLMGYLKISGSRNLIKRFRVTPSTRPPHRPLGGLFVQIVRGQGGMLPHAFIGKGDVWERTGRERHKIHRLTTVSLPGGWGRVSAKVEEAIARHLEKNLSTIM